MTAVKHESLPPPGWWRALQESFAAATTAPLSSAGGVFRAERDRYPHELVARIRDAGPGPRARLAIYQEQYWMRLFAVMQELFPRTARIVGEFSFNRITASFVAAEGVPSRDLADLGAGFFAHVESALRRLAPAATHGYEVIEVTLRELVGAQPVTPQDAVTSVFASVEAPWSLAVQALALDESERRAFRAPFEPPWSPDVPTRATLAERQPRFAASFSLVRLDYPLEPRVPPAREAMAVRLPHPRHVVVVRTANGFLTRRVDPLHARLLARAASEPIEAAARAVEEAAGEALAPRFRASLDAYIDAALTGGWWVGAQPPSAEALNRRPRTPSGSLPRS